MKLDTITVANTILDLANKRELKDLTPMKLQKLLFIADALYMKKYNKRLVESEVQKWKYGPVYYSVYREFSVFGSKNITNYANNADGSIYIVPRIRKDIYEHLNSVLDIFGYLSASKLSHLTHMKGTAWDLTDDKAKYISNENIKNGIIYRNK